MIIYLKLAWRNIWRNRRRTLITVSAIVFAVIAAILMQSVNRGSYEGMIDRSVTFSTGYLQLQDYRYKEETSLDNVFFYDEQLHNDILAADDRITHLVPRIESFMLAANGGYTRGSFVLGVDVEKEHAFNQIQNYLVQGRFFEPGEQAVVVSNGLMERLELSLSDTLVLIGQGRFGMSASGLFEIAGVVEHPLREMNNRAVYMPLETAQWLLSADDHLTSLLISPEHERQTNRVAASLRDKFEGSELVVYTWPEMIPELLELMELDLAGPRFITLVLYLVIGFGFLGTVLTMTMERLREFGVLLSIGMKRGRLCAVVFLETLFISIIGVLTGMIASLFILWLINPIRLSGEAAEALIGMGFEPILPMSFAADQFYMQGLFVFIIAMVVFLFPLIKITRLNILNAARN